MCFSATASFATAGMTAVAGVTALRGARRPAHLLLGAVPLLFAVHQLAEGMQWLALTGAATAAWSRPAMFAFLIVAKVVWPVWVPLSFLALEEDSVRRKRLRILLFLGIGLSAALAYGLASYPLGADIGGHHIRYRLAFPPWFRWPTDILYPVVTVLPLLLSGGRLVRWLGVILLGSLVVSKLFFFQYAVSVWCFFAAFLSVLIVLVIRASPQRTGAPNDSGR